jgi:hypothetical protein
LNAEERDESERRLRQSLYVQTCEIISVWSVNSFADGLVEGRQVYATKELIVRTRAIFVLDLHLY